MLAWAASRRLPVTIWHHPQCTINSRFLLSFRFSLFFIYLERAELETTRFEIRDMTIWRLCYAAFKRYAICVTAKRVKKRNEMLRFSHPFVRLVLPFWLAFYLDSHRLLRISRTQCNYRASAERIKQRKKAQQFDDKEKQMYSTKRWGGNSRNCRVHKEFDCSSAFPNAIKIK